MEILMLQALEDVLKEYGLDTSFYCTDSHKIYSYDIVKDDDNWVLTIKERNKECNFIESTDLKFICYVLINYVANMYGLDDNQELLITKSFEDNLLTLKYNKNKKLFMHM